jgi:hypothetical protein
MQQWTEQQISLSLDGTFTRLTEAGHVVRRKVPRDFIPAYDPPKEQKQASSQKGRKRGPCRPWSPEDDAGLIELRKMRVTKEECARLLRRCRKKIAERCNHLASIGRI